METDARRAMLARNPYEVMQQVIMHVASFEVQYPPLPYIPQSHPMLQK
jgi:hypothetical protein